MINAFLNRKQSLPSTAYLNWASPCELTRAHKVSRQVRLLLAAQQWISLSGKTIPELGFLLLAISQNPSLKNHFCLQLHSVFTMHCVPTV